MIRVLIQFYFNLYLIRADVCLSTVQIAMQVKSQRKSKRVAAYVGLKFKEMLKGIS